MFALEKLLLAISALLRQSFLITLTNLNSKTTMQVIVASKQTRQTLKTSNALVMVLHLKILFTKT